VLLFSALLPPEEVVESLRGELDRLGAWVDDELRWSTPDRWHITLGFYGKHDDPAEHVELLGPEALNMDNHWSYELLRARGNSIEGGTTEVLKNIVAERVLGLPKAR